MHGLRYEIQAKILQVHYGFLLFVHRKYKHMTQLTEPNDTRLIDYFSGRC